MNGPLFSIVIATYNRAGYIGETLDSIGRQTLRDYEIVVVDDGSTDDTAEVLAPYADRIRLFRQANRGVAAAWNRGIRESRGERIAFLASDDCWEPRALERIDEVFRKEPDVGLVSVRARVMLADGTPTRRIQGKATPGPDYTPADLLRGGWCSWFAVRREPLERVGLYDERLRTAEECELCLRLYAVTRFYAIHEPLLLRRIHDDNLTRDQRLNARNWVHILDKLERDRPEFVRANASAFRRARGKEHLRLGRELLAHYAEDDVDLATIRAHLRRSIAAYPWFPRAYAYLAWSLLAPGSYRSWRRLEQRRLRHG